MGLRFWIWLIVTYCFLLRSALAARWTWRLDAEVQSEMIPYTDKQAILKCVTKPPEATVEWVIDGEPIISAYDTDNKNQLYTVERNKLIVHLHLKAPADNFSPKRLSENHFKSVMFQCKATFNNETVISDPAKIIITFLDDFDHQLDQEINIVEGNTAVIQCKPPNSTPTALMEYYFNDTLISKSTDRYFLANSGHLQIFKSRPSDAGLYRCVAFNTFLGERRNASWTIKLNVRPMGWSDPNSSQKIGSAKNDLHFAVKPANEIKAVLGKHVTLECVAQATGSPPEIAWFKKGGGLKGEDEVKIHYEHPFYELNGGNLILGYVADYTNGIYICRATAGSVSIETSTSFEIQVTPSFKKQRIKSVTVNEGSDFSLDCQADGIPKPTPNWFFNGASIISHLNFGRTGPQYRLDGVTFSPNYTKLTVQSAHSSIHSGIFQCFAWNQLWNGDVKTVFNLAHVKVIRPGEKVEKSTTSKPNKREILMPPTRPKVNKLSDDSVMVYWEASKKSSLPVYFFKLQYKELGEKKSAWKTLPEDILSWVTTYTVSDLKPGLIYRFRVMAVFSNGDYKASPNSEVFHLVRTNPVVKRPKDSPTIMAVVPQNPTSIEVVWDNYKETSIEGFIIHVRATSSAGDYFQITVPGSTKLSHIVSRLSPSTSYEFKLQAFNTGGVSDYSRILTATTFDDPVSTTTTEIITINKGLDKNLNSRIENNMDIFLFIVGGIGAFALSVFIVCCVVQCAGRYKQNPKRKKDGPSIPQRTNSELNNGSLLHNHHQTTQSSDEYKSETDTLSSHPDKSSINNVTASVSIDHFPAYHEEIKDKRNNYQTRTYMIDTYCDESSYGIGNGVVGRTGSWSRKSRKKCFETDAGIKLIATASSHNSLHRKYLYENDNHVPSTLERKRSTFKSEEHLKCSLNARIHSKSSSFTKLDGTLERKKKRANGEVNTLSPQLPPVPERSSNLSNHRSLSSSRLNGSLEKRKKSRLDYVNTSTLTNKNDNKSTESKMNSYNGSINHMNSKPPLLIMQSTC